MTNYALLIARDAARHAEAERIYEFAIARTQSKDFNDLPYVPAHIMTNLANLYIKMGDLGRAETMYNRALGVLPTHPQAGCNLAIVLVHLRRERRTVVDVLAVPPFPNRWSISFVLYGPSVCLLSFTYSHFFLSTIIAAFSCFESLLLILLPLRPVPRRFRRPVSTCTT